MFSKSTIKYIQSLQHKKFRDEYNAFVAEGPKVVTELLLNRMFTCKAVYALAAWYESIDQALATAIVNEIVLIHDFELEKISAYSTANNVVAVFEKKLSYKPVYIKNKFTLVLDDIRDPGNMGTIIRTADWFGIQHIICSENTVDMYNPKVVQSTMASLGRPNIFYTDIKSWLKTNQPVLKLAATLDGKPVKDIKNINEAIIIIGNESAGIRPELLMLADQQITIPKIGAAESLNAAVATAIIVYALTTGT